MFDFLKPFFSRKTRHCSIESYIFRTIKRIILWKLEIDNSGSLATGSFEATLCCEQTDSNVVSLVDDYIFPYHFVMRTTKGIETPLFQRIRLSVQGIKTSMQWFNNHTVRYGREQKFQGGNIPRGSFTISNDSWAEMKRWKRFFT